MVLSTTLAPIADQTVLAGAPLHVALDGFDDEADVLTYQVSVSGDADLTAEVLEGNRSLRMSVEGFGDMLIELFETRAPRGTARIIELAESGFYDDLTFHRIVEGFMIQGGDPDGDGTGGSQMEFDDEFHLDLQHTSAGIFSMAKAYDDGNDSQFFITAGPTRSLDFNHSILGFLNEGDDVRQAIEAVDVEEQPGGNPPEVSKPVEPVVISSIEVFVDEENGVLVLSAPEGAAGEADVTVTVSDGNGGTAQQTFHVVVQADPTDNYPFLRQIDPITTSQDTPVTFTIDAVDAEGDPMTFYADGQGNADLDVSVDSSTGEVTITPLNGVVGVHEVLLAVRAETPADYYEGRDVWDLQFVPLYISPAAPSSVQLVDGFDSGPDPDDLITSFNNAADDPIEFLISGVVPGAEVTLFIGGQAVGQAVAGAETVEISAAAVGEIPDGAYGVSVGQVLRDQDVDVVNFQDTVDLASDLSTAVPLVIDTTDPAILSQAELEAAEGRQYLYDVASNEEPGGGLIYRLLEAPAGMAIANPANGRIEWTPAAGQAGTHSVVVEAMDAAGNTSKQEYDVEVAAAPTLDPIGAKLVDEESPLSFTATASGGAGDLTFSLGAGTPANATIGAETGEFLWTPGEEQGPGVREIVVLVTDTLGASASRTVNVTVKEVNQAPTLDPIADRTVDEGEAIEFHLRGRDEDQPANPLLYGLAGEVPDGAAVDPSTGRFTWTPGKSQGGEAYLFTATVRDPASEPVVQTFTVTVNEFDDPPEFAPVEAVEVEPGGRLELPVTASDPDASANEIRYSLDPGAPEGAAIDPVSGLLTWDVPADQPGGAVELTVRATEQPGDGGSGAESTTTVFVTVDSGDPNGFAGVTDLTVTMLFEASQQNGGAGGLSGDSAATGDEDGADGSQALLLTSVSSSAGAAAADGDRFDFSPGGGTDTGAVGNSTIFGTDLDPGTGSGGGAYAGDQIELPTLEEEQARGEREAPDDESAEFLLPPPDEQPGERGNAEYVEVPEHLVAANDAAVRSLTEPEAAKSLFAPRTKREHPSAEQTKREHPSAEQTKREHPSAEQTKREHLFAERTATISQPNDLAGTPRDKS